MDALCNLTFTILLWSLHTVLDFFELILGLATEATVYAQIIFCTTLVSVKCW